ncbi:MAG: flavodoxin family protein [Candidatus Izemoplasmataceae bacterium]
MSSKILMINGSPNLNGYTMACAEKIFEPFTYELLHAYRLNINPCDDCKVCHHVLRCKHKDAMESVIEKIKHSDTLILVSPVYFGAMTDQLLKIINRFQQLFEAKYTHKSTPIKLKNLYVISTCAAPHDTMFEGIKLTTSILKELFSVENVSIFTANNTDHITNILSENKSSIEQFSQQVKKELE